MWSVPSQWISCRMNSMVKFSAKIQKKVSTSER